jgi:hypothetical protein
MDISQSIAKGASVAIKDAVGSYFNHWFQEHQLIWWLISNPGWGLVMLLLSIALFVGLFGAIGRGIEQAWIWLLRTPLQIVRPTTIWLWQKLSNKRSPNLLLAQDRQIDFLVHRLRQIQQEQDKLMKELLKIVKTEP